MWADGTSQFENAMVALNCEQFRKKMVFRDVSSAIAKEFTELETEGEKRILEEQFSNKDVWGDFSIDIPHDAQTSTQFPVIEEIAEESGENVLGSNLWNKESCRLIS